MTRTELEHILRAAGAITGCRDIVVVGSQAILAAAPEAPASLRASMDADVYPLDEPEKAALIEGCIGELSTFHQTFGYYAHGIAPETARLPRNWRERWIRVQNENTGGTAGLSPAPADLASSKLIAGREKDLAYVRELLRYHFIEPHQVRALANEYSAQEAALMLQRLQRCLWEDQR